MRPLHNTLSITKFAYFWHEHMRRSAILRSVVFTAQ